MASIVELRDRSDEQIEQMIEDARAEMFNLRFQKAATRLNNTSRIKEVRRDIAQGEAVLHKRQLAIEAAAEHAAIAEMLTGRTWQATARYSYEDVAHIVDFVTDDGSKIVTAWVDLNKKQPKARRARAAGKPQQVVRYEV